MLQFRGKSDIGDQINKAIGEFAKANDLTGIITEADFNDDAKLGNGKAKVDRLTNLLNIFNNPKLNFGGNRAEGDDLLGDAYEYLMQHFATESGKSKGQFYTPAEVSRIIARVIDIDRAKSPDETLYDPTCGSGSLLLKAAGLAPHGITIYGQENDNATRALAVMNMWLHNFADADIRQGNTLADPLFIDDKANRLKTFNYAVANPPFSYKSWMNGLDPASDGYKRFDGYGAVPPAKNGDFAFLLHLLRSLKSKGKGCIVMPLGVLFRGNAEAMIRKHIIEKGYIKGIIGLPPNLFFGTGIAACLLILDKEGADQRDSIFMIDASRGFIKDGNKNRLRERDIHQIVDAYKNRLEIPRYSRNIPLSAIRDPKNEYNLNIPRYIDSQEQEDIQDIEAHLRGGIPKRDVDALENYWRVYPSLKASLFKPVSHRPDYYQLNIPVEDIKSSIYQHPEFLAFSKKMNKVFHQWEKETGAYIKELKKGLNPKKEIHYLSEQLLKKYNKKPLTDQYAMYQHLMDYWTETMQDDFYELAADGWKAGNQVSRLVKTTKKGEKQVTKQIPGIEGLEGRLIPPDLLIEEYFAKEKRAIEKLETEAETAAAKMEELAEEHGNEGGLLENAMADGKITKSSLSGAIRELGKRNSDNEEEYDLMEQYKWLMEEEAEKKKAIKSAWEKLEGKVIAQYPKLSTDEIKSLVVDKKWMANIAQRVQAEMDEISQRLTQRIKELAERYATPLPELEQGLSKAETLVKEHLKQMHFKW